MEMEKNEKVLAMYQAVWEMMDEGYDVHRMKVADITGRAGIGKGTAYEYFRSKEELVRKALCYEFQMQYQELKLLLEKQKSFREGIYSCFSWLEDTTERRKRFTIQAMKQKAFRLSMEEEEEETAFREQRECGFSVIQEIIGFLTKKGKEEGVIGEKVPDRLASLEILSQILAFSVYQVVGNPAGEEENSKTKLFLYDTIRKSLK